MINLFSDFFGIDIFNPQEVKHTTLFLLLWLFLIFIGVQIVMYFIRSDKIW
jgi:hypothetical protein